MRWSLLLVVLWPMLGAAASLTLELGRMQHSGFAIEGLRVDIGAEGDPAELGAARVSIGDRSWADVGLRCRDFHLADGEMHCRGGVLRVPGLIDRWTVDLRLAPAAKSGRLALRTPDGETLDLTLAPSGSVRAVLGAFAVARLQDWFPAFSSWQPIGRFDGRLEYRPTVTGSHITAVGRLDEAQFGSADGLRAAEGLVIEVDTHAHFRAAGWDWGATLTWLGGEAYWHPLYLTAGAQLEASGRFVPGLLTVHRAGLAFEGVRTVEATATYDLEAGHLQHAALAIADADLDRIGPQFLTPLLTPAHADKLSYSGMFSAGIRIDDAKLVALDVALDGAGIVLADGDLSIGPMTGVLAWMHEGPTTALLSVTQGRWQDLVFGAFDVIAQLDGQSVAVERIAIPVLDGRVVLSELALHRDAEGWSGHGAATVEPISMSLLTEAVGVPVMSGVLSASMPGLRVSPGELALDGALVISVFDGYVRASNLHVIEPFGVAAHLYGDVEARNIDLAQLTNTFAFGSITGFIDADILGLELARWRPVRFDAQIRSSPGRYTRRISQRAVQNISALGGPGAGLAIQRGFLGFFETFGYSQIGLSCRLARGVCQMDGLPGQAANDGFVIIRGGGIPALNVIGYNRRVDWQELLNRVQRAIDTNAAPIID